MRQASQVTITGNILGFALNAAFGYLAFTVFVILIVEIVRESSVPPSMLVLTRLYDVGVGCVIVLVATLVAGIGRQHRNT